MEKIAIVGMGTMGSAIRELLKDDYEIIGIGRDDPLSKIQIADAVFLAVKPQIFLPEKDEHGNIIRHGLSDKLWPQVADNQYFVSIMAGITEEDLSRGLGTNRVVRAMPSIAGLIAWHTRDNGIDDQALGDLMSHWDMSVRLETEEEFEGFTAVFGCGPAYFSILAEAMAQKAVESGFSTEQAHMMVVQTALGWAGIAGSKVDFKEIIRRVKSKGGATEAAEDNFNKNNLTGILYSGIDAARRRTRELGGGNSKKY